MATRKRGNLEPKEELTVDLESAVSGSAASVTAVADTNTPVEHSTEKLVGIAQAVAEVASAPSTEASQHAAAEAEAKKKNKETRPPSGTSV